MSRGARGWARVSLHLGGLMHRAAMKALEHDFLNVAQAMAYSSMLALFPALIVAAALVALLPFSMPLRTELAIFFDRVLPPTVSPLLDAYFMTTRHAESMPAMAGALLVSVTGATSAMATLMEGFRRAYELPDTVGAWALRRRALLLVPLSLLPFAAASAIVVFGNLFTLWLTRHLGPLETAPVLLLAVVVRWSVAVLGCVGILTVVYHMGTPVEARPGEERGRRRRWREVVPGAGLATVLWFAATIAFGWYVTRFANYSRVYGSLGAGIALMIWLYLVALCVLFGAEFNAQLFLQRSAGRDGKQRKIPSKMAVTGGGAG